MSTRGVYGFQIDGMTKIIRNQYDSYPRGIGQDLLDAVRALRQSQGDAGLADIVRRLRCVELDHPIDDSDIRRAEEITGTSRSGWIRPVGSADTLRCLCNEHTGALTKLEDIVRFGLAPDGHHYVGNGLLCAWGYVVDLDAMRFEVYSGFLEADHDRGRFSSAPRVVPKFAPIAGLLAWPLDDVPDDWDEMSTIARCILTDNEDDLDNDGSAHRRLTVRRLLDRFPEMPDAVW